MPHQITLVDIIPLDVGTAGFTEYSHETFLKKALKYHRTTERVKRLGIGQIHSHHGMSAFFSGTDMEHITSLITRAPYFSLILSRTSKWVCRAMFKTIGDLPMLVDVPVANNRFSIETESKKKIREVAIKEGLLFTPEVFTAVEDVMQDWGFKLSDDEQAIFDEQLEDIAPTFAQASHTGNRTEYLGYQGSITDTSHLDDIGFASRLSEKGPDEGYPPSQGFDSYDEDLGVWFNSSTLMTDTGIPLHNLKEMQ